MTDQQVFLDWCKARKIRPKKKKHSSTIYALPKGVVKIAMADVVIRRSIEWTVYFTDDGRWIGGSNQLWDEQLPWIKQATTRIRMM